MTDLCDAVFLSGLAVHKALGPGLLESAYEDCLARALTLRGLTVERQVVLPIVYEGITSQAAYRLDIIVNRAVIIEVKAVLELNHLHRAQLLTYLKLSGYRVGYLINFNVCLFKEGVRRLGK